ncbi:FecCD family ABC transporter permease [Silvanigrella paludirubra]|uniref:FecCD family ABC transporter permease n=1 Tax=Silvanigrella paludirubra TaxID=2499159 RepID=UPI001386706A|nr:iron ABC transporter permease [Silvanigrella paludirubra]
MKKDFSFKIFIIYILIFLVSSFLSIYFGSTDINIFSSNLIQTNNDLYLKILELRMNGLIQAAIIGAILALCGYILQKLLRNPLADPFILGISSGGSCFASLFFIFNSLPIISSLPLTILFPIQSIFAFIGCMFSFIILILARKNIKNLNDDYIFPVIGIIINSFFSSILMLIFSLAKPEQLSEIHNFLMGSLQPISIYPLLFIVTLSIYPIYYILKKSKFYDYMLFGDDFAKSMGINPVKLRNNSILMICILISLAVSTSGIIAFIGLIIPHIIRKIHRFSSYFEIIICMILGAIVLVNADTLSRSLFSPAQLSVGIFTAILGAPMLSFILLNRHKI